MRLLLLHTGGTIGMDNMSVLQCLAGGFMPRLTSQMMQHARDAADGSKKNSSSFLRCPFGLPPAAEKRSTLHS